MKIEGINKNISLEIIENNLILCNYDRKVHTIFKYIFSIKEIEDIEKIKEFFKKHNENVYINFYYDAENKQVKLEYENKNTSDIVNSIIVDIVVD